MKKFFIAMTIVGGLIYFGLSQAMESVHNSQGNAGNYYQERLNVE